MSKVVAVDCGHGGSDTGTVVAGTQEKDITLALGRCLQSMLSEKGFTVYLTRTEDKKVELDERTTFANRIGCLPHHNKDASRDASALAYRKSQSADLFLSLHVNYSPNKHISGIELYTLSPDLFSPVTCKGSSRNRAIINAYRNDRCTRSEQYAQTIRQSILKSLKNNYPQVVDRGIKNAVFQVVAGTCMPAVLIEIGYLSHDEERARIAQDPYLKAIACGIVHGIMKLFP